MRIGVDFGTTRTVVACADRGNYPILSFHDPELGDLEGYPSLVAEDRGKLYYGLDALKRARAGATVLRSFKRLLGEAGASQEGAVRVGRSEHRLLDLLTDFFRTLERDLRRSANLAPHEGGAPFEAAISVPANAKSTQRFLTLEAFQRAGFRVRRMINEPSAAGIEFAHRHRHAITAKRQNVLVYDLGGGTFDASLVRLEPDTHSVLGSSGIGRLGGDDFDAALLALVLERRKVSAAALAPGVREQLLEHARELKENLHPNSRRIFFELGEFLPGQKSVELRVTDYYERCAPLVDQTLAVIDRLAAPLAESELAALYVVGGASALPLVARRLRDKYGRRVQRSPYPSGSIAFGLAVAADPSFDLRLEERLSRGFGVFREAEDGRTVAFDPLFAPETPLPAPGHAEVCRRTYRPLHNLGHFRYVECDHLGEQGEPQGDVMPYGDVFFPFDPALQRVEVDLPRIAVQRRGDAGAWIEERYSLAASGVVELTITDLESGFHRSLSLGREKHEGLERFPQERAEPSLS